MTPREALDVLRDALIAWRDAGASLADAPHPQGTYDYNAASERLSESLDEGIPALKTLAECVVVSRETMQMLVEVAEERAEELEEQVNEDNYDPETGTIDEDSAIAQQSAAALRAAIAEAEEAMR